MSNKDDIRRYKDGERLHHWIVAVTFILLAMSGLALFHPSLYWLTNLFGGGQWTRILHPFIGLVMFVSVMVLMVRFWRHNLVNRDDLRWIRYLPDALHKREGRLPPVGRYNAGQKIIYWSTVIGMFLLLFSGLIMWQPYFAPVFPIGLVRFAILVHAFSAILLMMVIILHIYAAIWVKGSLQAMVRGTVSRTWAKKHHPLWYREVTQEERK